MQLKVWCEFCEKHQPAAPIKLEVKDGDGYWGDLFCSVCGLVIATLSAEVPSRLILVPGADAKYGCHCDLEPGMEPDGCVLDTGYGGDCAHAVRLQREGKTKFECEYWKQIEVNRPDGATKAKS